MITVSIPKDFTQVESKVFLNLTKRQIICFSPAVLIGVPLFFVTRGSIGNSAATFLMIVVMLPFFLAAFYKHNEEPLERYLWHMIQTRYIRPKYRPYVTNNIYSALEKQYRYDKEVKARAKQNASNKTKNRKACRR
ncbi:MAG: PrgI family protein [Aeriscardovia sp.]|nr:PrgI family protein [Aeriscardovia sp.]